MKASELRGMGKEELVEKEKSLKKDLFNLNFQRKMGGVEKPSRFGLIRRDIARILTVLKEREIEDGRNKEANK